MPILFTESNFRGVSCSTRMQIIFTRSMSLSSMSFLFMVDHIGYLFSRGEERETLCSSYGIAGSERP